MELIFVFVEFNLDVANTIINDNSFRIIILFDNENNNSKQKWKISIYFDGVKLFLYQNQMTLVRLLAPIAIVNQF